MNHKISAVSLLLTVASVVSHAQVAPSASLAGVQGATSSASLSTAHSPALQERNPRYTVRRGDSFDLDFALTPEFNQAVAVQPDGYISLKSVGSIFIVGQTIPELTQTLKNAYSEILQDPVIAISLKDFEKPYFIALGQVDKPGKYDLRSELTITQAVAVAGGFTEKAKHSQVVLFRPTGTGGFEARLIDIKKLLASRDLSEDIRLAPGDMVYVPQNTYSKIRPFLPTPSMGAYYNPATF